MRSVSRRSRVRHQARARGHPERRAPPPADALSSNLHGLSDRRPAGRTGADAEVVQGGDSGRQPNQPDQGHLGQCRTDLPWTQGAGRTGGVARKLPARIPARHGGPRQAARRRGREQPGALGSATRDAGRARDRHGDRAGRGAARGRARSRSPGLRAALGHRGHLAPGLSRAARRTRGFWIQGRDQPPGDRRQRHPGVQSA